MRITQFSRDIYLTPDGDLFMDKDKGRDLYRAGPGKNELLESLVAKRLLSSKGDWQFAPYCGANLVDFIGQPNTRTTAEYIKAQIAQSLNEDNMLIATAFEIDIAPTDENTVLLLLSMTGIETGSPIIRQAYGYDLRDSKMVPRIINI